MKKCSLSNYLSINGGKIDLKNKLPTRPLQLMTEATSKVQAANTIALCGGKNYQWYLVDLKKILKEQNILQEWLNDVTSLELREDLCTVQCKNATKGVDEP